MPTKIASLNEFKIHNDLLGKGNEEDQLFNQCLDAATSIVHSMLTREVTQGTYTEVHEGTDTDYLRLVRGPVNSVTGVWEVTYDDQANEELTQIYDWRIEANTDYRERGVLVRTSGLMWPHGVYHYKVTYNSGWSSASMPADLKQACLFAATWVRNKRKDAGSFARSVGSGTERFRGEAVLRRELQGWLASYMDVPGIGIVRGGRAIG